MAVQKKTKASMAKKKAEELKAKRKQIRMAKVIASTPSKGTKGKSLVAQSKKKKK
jgi:hypothetical protein